MLNADCRAHELDNLYVVDTSFFPSIGAVNPALTAMANALRVGDHLLARSEGSPPSGARAGAERRGAVRQGEVDDRPSGEQVEIALGDQRAVVVEVGGGLRDVLGGGRDAARRLRGRRDVHVRARAGADAVAEPAPGRQLRVRRAAPPARRSTEPETSNAIHGLVRWARWTVGAREPRPSRDGARAPSAARLPVLARAQRRVRALRDGLAVRTTATNIGAEPCPYGSGAHPVPDARDAEVDSVDPARPGADGAALRRARHPDRRGPVEGTEYDFRAAAADRRDEARQRFTDLERDEDGLARVELRDPGPGARLALWVDESYRYLMVFTGDPLPDVDRRSLAVEPMTCPPNAFRSGEGADPPRAGRVVHEQPGASVRPASRRVPPPDASLMFALR